MALSETFEVPGRGIANLTLVAPPPDDGVFQAGVDLMVDVDSNFSAPMTQRVAATISITPDYRLTASAFTITTKPSEAANEVRIEFGRHLEITDLIGVVCPKLCGIVSVDITELRTQGAADEHGDDGRAYVVRVRAEHSRLPTPGEGDLWVRFDPKSATGAEVTSITIPMRVVDNLRMQGPARVDFGQILVDSNATRTIIISSPNSSPLSIADVRLETPSNSACMVGWSCEPRASGRFARLELTLTCSQPGPLSEELTVVSSTGHTSATIQLRAHVVHDLRASHVGPP